MDQNEFVKRLRNVPAPKPVYESLGLSEEQIRNLVNSYSATVLNNNIHSSGVKDPLIELIGNYDCSSIQIGMITFSKELIEYDDYFKIGSFESDFLCLSKFSYEVVLIPFDNPQEVMLRCAATSYRFLDALIEAAIFLENCGIDSELRENQQKICDSARKCAEISGGQIYLEFYQLLLGCFE